MIKPTTPEPTIHSLFEPQTGTWQYVVADPSTHDAVIIDSVLDYDPSTQKITTSTADSILRLITSHSYNVTHILETHAHADHLTAASYLAARLAQTTQGGTRPPIGIGRRITQVQSAFGRKYEVPEDERAATVFDTLFDDDETFAIGGLTARVVHLPGHTPDHIGYVIGDNVFCGDSIFPPDIGTARCDFPGGDAASLYASAQKLLAMPGHVRIFTGHDYPPASRGAPVPWTSVSEHRERNVHLAGEVGVREFVERRTERDSGLAAPRLLHQSLQVNVRAGRLPGRSADGVRLLRLPVRVEGAEW
ncbi:Metallo-hydrolase/oxidoreductase [Aaosphaeria arxii CBS 175.79]|uniref:Metallo-hydrolase/oxidoreductase n=1 Tax=Aaosphaeria arxii CBS 175.79 TaxID=1450172 RepID=A0A6A5XZT0_9PLEO|nr:Metallo-hydrolase/oxidoreductase [Aaosphaeria arxii CBS 175.79]KAF2018317.1 Metallo-hydrolase/oxidoreductase [Aaosphaeria arxii CBS 175.79]